MQTFKTQRQKVRERQKVLRQQLNKEWKTWKRDLGRRYIKRKEKTKSGHLKILKELNKPIIPKPDKDFWLKKIFGNDCEFKIISYQERANKFWINKKRSV